MQIHAWCADCEQKPVDPFFELMNNNYHVISIIVLYTSLFLLFIGFYQIYNKNRQSVYDKNPLLKITKFLKFTFSILINIFVLSTVSHFAAYIFYLFSFLLVSLILDLFINMSGPIYSEGYGYILSVIYFLLVYKYTKYIIKNNKKLNTLIIIAVVIFIFILDLIYIPNIF